MKTSDAVVAALDGVEIDAGVAYEISYAKVLGKPLIGLKTDYRPFSRVEEVNLMLEAPLTKICKNTNDLIDTLSETK